MLMDLRQIPLIELASEESPLTAIEGFSCHLNFITSEVEEFLIDHIDKQPWNQDWKRRVQQYGSSYGKSRASQAPIPTWLMPVCKRVTDEQFFLEMPNQIIVNEYQPGQGIAPHSDYLTTGTIVASLSLGAPILMDFYNPEGKKLSHLLERRSLFILSGKARYQWKHGIAPRKADRHNGVIIQRSRRISCTFRNALPETHPHA